MTIFTRCVCLSCKRINTECDKLFIEEVFFSSPFCRSPFSRSVIAFYLDPHVAKVILIRELSKGLNHAELILDITLKGR